MSINHSKYSLYSRLEIIFINGYQNFTKRFEEVIEKSKDKSWLQQILSPKYLTARARGNMTKKPVPFLPPPTLNLSDSRCALSTDLGSI